MKIKIFCLSICILCIFACENKQEDIESFVNVSLPDQELKDVNILYSLDGDLKLQVKAKKMSRFSEQDIVELRDSVVMDVKSEMPDNAIRLVCDEATIDNKQNIITLNGNVKLVQDNILVLVDQLIWDRNIEQRNIRGVNIYSDIIYSNSAAFVKYRNFEINTPYFRSTPNFDFFESFNANGEWEYNINKEN